MKELPFTGKATIVDATETELRTDSATFNNATKRHQMVHEEFNTAYNHHIIIDRFKKGIAMDVGDVPRPPMINGEKMPAIIVGSGPSFDENVKWLKDWKGAIIATTSQALTLMYHGIEPTHLVCLDPFSTWEEIKGIDWSQTRTKLVAHPGIWPDMIENWPNEMYMYIENIGRPDSFYATTQKHMYSRREKLGPAREATFNFYIKTELTLFACSPAMQLFTAEVLGYGAVFLMGIDFAYHHGKERFTNYTLDDDGKWVEHTHPLEGIIRPMVRTNSGHLSEAIHLYYKKNFLSAWVLGGATLYTTDHGIITEIPYHSMQSVVKAQGTGFERQSAKFISDHAEPYLESVGAYVLRSDSGTSFIECKNPMVDLIKFMEGMNNKYRCDRCGSSLSSNDPTRDGTGDECPHCRDVIHDHMPGHLTRENSIDIEANMKRIVGYMPVVVPDKVTSV